MSNNNLKFGDEGSGNQEIINYQLFSTLKKQGQSIKALEESSSAIDELLYGKKDRQTGERTTTGLIQENAKLKEQQESFRNYKIDFITVGGIFVSIFTFVSIEIQILKYVCDFWRIAGFSLIMFGALSSFAFLIQYIGKNWTQQKYDFPKLHFFLFCILPFAIGIFLPLGNIIYKDSCIVYEKEIKDIEYRIDKIEGIKNVTASLDLKLKE